jgi:beta-lactamase class C
MDISKNKNFKFISFVMITVLLVMISVFGCDISDRYKNYFVAVGDIPPKSLVDTAFNRLLDAQFKQKLDEYQCPGAAILVMKNNQVIFKKSYGTKSRYSQDAIDTSTVFRLGSVSKGFAGILAAILIDKKVIQLDDPLTLYIPEITIKAKSKDHILRVRHILTHSSGFTEHAYSNLVDDNHDMETIINNLNRLTPRDSTGKAYAYQNAAFGLIEKVVESATGMSFTDALDFYLFSPLNMCSTTCTFEDISNTKNVCTGHKYNGEKVGFTPIDIKPHYYNVVSAGGINANLVDMEKWLNALIGYRPDVISPNARAIAFTSYINTSHEDKYFNSWPGLKKSHYGLGWRLLTTKTNNIVYHGGLVNGFRTEIAFDRDKEIGIVILYNSLCGYSHKSVHEFFDLWNSFYTQTGEQTDYL